MSSSASSVPPSETWLMPTSFCFHFPHPVRCPGCGEVVQPQTVRVANSTIWCDRCLDTLYLVWPAIAGLADVPSQSRYWGESRGLRVYYGDRYVARTAVAQAAREGIYLCLLQPGADTAPEDHRPYRDTHD